MTTNLHITALPVPGGGWHGALAQGESIVWKCGHWHANKYRQSWVPKGESLQLHPEKRSAVGCATVELDRRGKEIVQAESEEN